MSALHVEVQGRGPALVLVHGWGMHGGVWAPLLPWLTPHFTVHVPDLPAHGHSRALSMAPDAARVAEQLLARLPEPATWLGWSLGGIVALAAAERAPAQVARLVLVAGTPRFSRSADWPHGMAAAMLREFADGLERDYRATLLRFLSLQLGSAEHERKLLRELRAALYARGEPAAGALRAGLAILERADLRAAVRGIRTPTLLIHGSRDRLVPPGAGEFLAAHLPQARLLRLEGEGHAPFLSRAAGVARAVTEFAHE
jgi:pimeloyl-[acyl-carrier protein] methyl ester esterase